MERLAVACMRIVGQSIFPTARGMPVKKQDRTEGLILRGRADSTIDGQVSKKGRHVGIRGFPVQVKIATGAGPLLQAGTIIWDW